MNNFLIRLGLALLITLPWSSPALCGEIHYAAQIGDLAKVEALLKVYPRLVFSMDIAGRKTLGPTPLHVAAVHGHKDVAELLLANKAEVNAGNDSGRTPLHEAVLKDHKDMATLLLTKGGDSNAKDNNGVTPLHLAAAKGYKDMAILLLNKGGDVNAETSFGSTPLDMAKAIGNEEILELFRQHSGRVGSGVLISDIESVKPPQPLVQPLPPLTEKARMARIDPGFGSMMIQGISRKDGTIDNIKVIKRLGYGLDESAINTIGKWRFKPGTLNGNPIDVGINIEMWFDVF
jgi:hypothetical protein